VEKRTQCVATKRNGDPCRGIPLAGKPHCFAHDDDLAGQRKQWAKDAGHAKSNAIRLKKRLGTGASTLTLPEVDALLCLALKGVLAGEIEPGMATAAATVAKAITTIRTASEMDERLAALERQAGLTNVA